jgi:ribosome silencing factor RsfS/YbeB/iojap
MQKDCISPEALTARLGEKRAAHVLGAARMAAELAARYGADAEKAKTAALWHDWFRSVETAELDALIDRYGVDPAFKGDANLAHGKIAAAFMERDLGIADAEILDAVRYHTTGRAGMSTLEKILYVADAAEPTRDYAGVSDLRETAWRDLDEACATTLENTLRLLRERERTPHEDSLRAFEWIKGTSKEREGGQCLNSRQLALDAAGALSRKKGNDIVILDIAEQSSFADFLVIASGNSVRQVGSLADDVEDALASGGVMPRHIEGKPESGWVLLDYGDIIVNVFTKEQRDLYRIEQIWGDGARIETPDSDTVETREV